MTSISGATFKTSQGLTDASGQVWTISPDANAWVLCNGVRAGGSYNAASLLWYGGTVYHKNTSGDYYGWDPVACTWHATPDPRAAVLDHLFYGINAHWDFPFNPTALIALMHDIGLTSIRMSYEGTDQSLQALASWARALQGSGISMIVCIDLPFTDMNGVLWSSESAAYAYAEGAAARVVQTLSPYGVLIYELGNEYTRRPEIITNSALMGSNLKDFSQAFWPQMRGLIRGMNDGAKASNNKVLTAALFCVGDIAASDALWFGLEPGGATGKPTVRWDITSWHNYQVYGNLFDIAPDGNGATGLYDLVRYCDMVYGVPFMVTEWGGIPEETDAQQAAYYTQALSQFYANRKRGAGIKAVMSYQMLGNPWGITTDQYALNASARYAALKSFIAANPA